MPTTNRSFRVGFLTAIGGLALVLAACSSSGGSTAPSAAAPSAAAPSAAASAAAAGGETYTVAVATGAVGSYLTGEDGKTLYIFTPDSTNKTACVDKCAASWPPFVISSDDTLTPGTGVTGTLATFARPDGKMQVTINGHPLYYYAADAKAGDTTGQGVGGKWFVGTPDGAVPSAAPASSAAPSAASRSY
jgi:predicted lipoprotein with Yx(FWY)xxD motif